jgi:CubicO group peptidase (beta-lactamase class C family)
MLRSIVCVGAALLALGCGDDADSSRRAPPDPLGRSTPEAAGITSDRLAALLDDVVTADLDVHSLTLARHGKIFLDARFFPWDGTRPHDVASCTKSLTSTAIGIALADGTLPGLDVPLAGFFPEHTAPATAGITLRHALTMTTGFDCVASPELTLIQMQDAPDWIEFALAVPMASEPGSEWRYCGTATHLLSGVITRATGAPLDEYLSQKLFEPVAADAPSWPRDPQGISHGWGDARLTPEAMIRVGQTWLGHGRFGDKHILGEDYMTAATQNQVGALGPEKGYGYGFWIGSNGSYYADGRGGQNVLVVPNLDLVVAVTGGQSPLQHALFLQRLSEELAQGISDAPLPENPTALAALDARLLDLTRAPTPVAIPSAPPLAAEVSGRDYSLVSNLLGWTSVSLDFEGDHATLRANTTAGLASAPVGLDGVPRIARGIRFAALPRYQNIDLALAGRWLDETSFEIEFDTIDTIDAGTLRFDFHDDTVTVVLYEKTFLLTEIAIESAT